MYANVNANDSAKPKRYKPETGDIIPQMTDGVGWIATADNRATWTFETSTRKGEGVFSESRKKGLPTIANPVYGYSAPAKSGAGIGVPVIIRAHNTRHACFFVPRSYTCSMVDCMGAEQSAPVSLIPGYANPVQFTTSEIGVSGGGSQNHESEAAAMLATTPTQNPQFIWLIAAVRRDMPTITAKIHHIAAETEREARRTLARDHVCFFAGRIRTGGAHA
ncbi:host cell division inhibitor Icd-like protein [Klebsiella electrica]